MSIEVCKFSPTPSDRMGALWTLTPVKNVCVIEYGPAGTTHFAIESVFEMGAQTDMNVYTTHMSNADVTFGNTEKLEGAIFEIEAKFSPACIFVFASSVSALIGADLENFCFELQDKIQAKLIPVISGGYDGDFNLGVETMLEIIVKEIVQPPQIKKEHTYNIIGSTIDSFHFLSDKTEIEDILKRIFDLSLHTCFTNFSALEDLEKAAEAQYNIVIRAEGIPAAEFMKKNFGIPYIYQKPYGFGGTLAWIHTMIEEWGLAVNKEQLLALTKAQKENITTLHHMLRNVEHKDVLLAGDYDMVVGMHQMLVEMGLNPTHLLVNHASTKTIDGLLETFSFKDKIIFKPSETEKEKILKEKSFYFIFGNDSIKRMHGKGNFMTIAHPNFNLYDFYPYLPFVGFKGSLYLLQYLMNYENEKHILS